MVFIGVVVLLFFEKCGDGRGNKKIKKER